MVLASFKRFNGGPQPRHSMRQTCSERQARSCMFWKTGGLVKRERAMSHTWCKKFQKCERRILECERCGVQEAGATMRGLCKSDTCRGAGSTKRLSWASSGTRRPADEARTSAVSRRASNVVGRRWVQGDVRQMLVHPSCAEPQPVA